MNKACTRTPEAPTPTIIMITVCFLGLLCIPSAYGLGQAETKATPEFVDSEHPDFRYGHGKRLLDPLAGDIIRKQSEKRFLDSLASDIIKKNTDKRFLDSLASDIIKKNTDKRFLDSLASDIIKRGSEKRFLDPLATDIITKREDAPGLPEIYISVPGEYYPNEDFNADVTLGQTPHYEDVLETSGNGLQGQGIYYTKVTPKVNSVNGHPRSRLNRKFKFNDSFLQYGGGSGKRYLDPLASTLIEKRYLDGIASSLIKKDDGEKRYLDGIASSLIKRDNGEKRYLDGIASSLIKKDDGEKRYLDGIASSLIKRDDGEKRYLDGIATSLIKKDDGEKRYLDGIASSLIKKDDGEKRYLDGIASSLIKKDDGEKRYLDGIASSLIKKDDGEKRYLDGIASSLIKKDDGEKRYLDGIASSLIKKDDGEKRYLDGIASSLIKKDDGEKRYLDGIASSLIKKDDGEKRYLDGIASSLIKKDDGEKRYLDGIASSLIKKDDGEKRYLDGIASSLIKKDDGEKRYLDGIASSLIKKDDGEKRYLDGIASSLIKKDYGEKRYLDGIASSLIKKDDGEKRYLDGIASSLIKKDDGEKRYLDGIASSLIKKDDGEKRYLDGIASSLIKRGGETRHHTFGTESSHPSTKRMFEVTDDLLDGSREGPQKRQMLHPGSKTGRRRRDVSIIPLSRPRTRVTSRRRRFIDSLAGDIIYKRRGGSDSTQEQLDQLINAESGSRSRHRPTSTKITAVQRALHNKAQLPPFYFSPYAGGGDDLDRAGDGGRILRNPSRFKFMSQLPEEVDLEELPKSALPGTFWTFNRVDPIFKAPLPHHLLMDVARPLSYGQIVYPFKPAQLRAAFLQSGLSGPHHRDDSERDAPDEDDDDNDDDGKRYADNPYVDEVAAGLFNDRRVFKKRYLDDIASSLLHKRYLDSLASSIITRSDHRDSDAHLGRGPFIKPFSGAPLRRLRLADSNGNPVSKRFIDSLASELLYKRAPGGRRAQGQDTNTDTYYLCE